MPFVILWQVSRFFLFVFVFVFVPITGPFTFYLFERREALVYFWCLPHCKSVSHLSFFPSYDQTLVHAIRQIQLSVDLSRVVTLPTVATLYKETAHTNLRALPNLAVGCQCLYDQHTIRPALLSSCSRWLQPLYYVLQCGSLQKQTSFLKTSCTQSNEKQACSAV